MKLNFKDWFKLKETGTSTANVAGVPMRAFGNAGNAFIAGDAQKQAKDCGLAMCGGGLPRKHKKRKHKKN